MAWPFSRLRTYTAGSQVPSSDLNAIQDYVVGRHNRSFHFTPASFLLNQPSSQWVLDESGAQARAVAASGAKQCILDLSPWLMAGDTIREIALRWQNGVTPSAGTVTFQLLRADVATFGTQTSVATSAGLTTNTGGASVLRSSTLSVAHTVLADTYYGMYFEMDATAGNDQAGFGGISLVLGV